MGETAVGLLCSRPIESLGIGQLEDNKRTFR